MAAIKQNTLNLQSLLDTANALPEAGVTVQKKSGTFTTGSSMITVNTGFKPDLLIITGLTIDTYEYQACFYFPEQLNASYGPCCAAYSDKYPYGIFFDLARTETGFKVIASKFDSSWNTTTVMATFSYVAYKYG